jgi:ABC-type multidrug transport system fused ATPase/permease subunit
MIPALTRFWRLLDREDHWHIYLALAFVIFGAVIEMIGVGLLPILVATLSIPQIVLQKLVSYTGWHAPEQWGFSRFVLVVMAVVCFFFIFKNLFSMWSIYRLGVFKAHLQGKLGRKLIHGYFHAPYEWHLNRSSSTIQQTLQQELPNLMSRIIAPGFNLLSETAVIFLVICLLLAIAPVATLLTAVVIVLTSAGYSYVFNVKLEKLGALQKQKNMALFQCVQHGLGGIKELKVLGRTDFYEKEYDKLIDDVARIEQFHVTIATNVKAVLEGVAVICLSLTVFTHVLLHQNMQALLPSLALFAVAAVRLMPSANRVLVVQGSMRIGLHGFCRLLDDLEEIENFRSRAKTEPEISDSWVLDRKIEISQLTYRYPRAESNCVNEINLSIRKGESIGLVGPSGAGKTTLVDLILGLLEPTSGTILVDGKNIHECLPAWRRQIGYIPQSIYLCDSTVRANIAFGLPDDQINDERVWAALKAAHLVDLVQSWPERLDKRIGEAGVRLSGGQRQRIGIARAIYHNPAVLVLDEATAALDNETEREIISVLETFRGEKTLITIAHRLTTVQRCDNLFFLGEGRIMASGPYHQLEAESPLFHRMVLAAKSNADAL